MKNFIFLVFLSIAQYAHSQSIGIGSNNPPHPSAALDVNSITKGFLIPRMLSTQRVAIPSPMKGLQVFDNNTNSFWYHNGTVWIEMTAGSFTIPYGNSINSSIPLLNLENTGSGISINARSISSSAIRGESLNGTGITGICSGGNGIYGYSYERYGIVAQSTTNFSIYASGRAIVASKLAIGSIAYDDVESALHIKSSTTGWGQHIRLENKDDTEYGEILHDNGGMKFRNFQTGEDFIFRSSTNSTLATITSAGNLCLAGSVTCASDIRLKQNITPLNASLSALSSLKGYHYYWKSVENPKLQTGLIAQEVQAIFPELVETDESSMLSVNYIGLIPHLIESVKELAEKTKKIEDLEARLARLEKLIK